MAKLEIPVLGQVIEDPTEIKGWLNKHGVLYDQWEAAVEFAADADQETVLGAYAHVLEPYMKANNYHVADVINVHPGLENIDGIRQKFLSEHIHTEDEVRFFVHGKGYFWFNLEKNVPVFAVLCESGDLLSVPAGAKHWFDMGSTPNVKVIRIFSDESGWVPHYTRSHIEDNYNKDYDTVL